MRSLAPSKKSLSRCSIILLSPGPSARLFRPVFLIPALKSTSMSTWGKSNCVPLSCLIVDWYSLSSKISIDVAMLNNSMSGIRSLHDLLKSAVYQECIKLYVQKDINQICQKILREAFCILKVNQNLFSIGLVSMVTKDSEIVIQTTSALEPHKNPQRWVYGSQKPVGSALSFRRQYCRHRVGGASIDVPQR